MAKSFRYLVGDFKVYSPSGVALNLVVPGLVYTRKAYTLSESYEIMCFYFNCDKLNILSTCIGSYQACPSTFNFPSSVGSFVPALVVIPTGFLLVLIFVMRLGFMIVAFSVDNVYTHNPNLRIFHPFFCLPLLLLVPFQFLGNWKIHWSIKYTSCSGFLLLIHSWVKRVIL